MGGLQDANSPIIEELIFLHDFINMILVFIITFVMFIIITIMLNSFINKNLLERQIIECIWTIIPAVILIQIAIPSLLLLYILDESIDSNLTIKAIGHNSITKKHIFCRLKPRKSDFQNPPSKSQSMQIRVSFGILLYFLSLHLSSIIYFYISAACVFYLN